MVAQAEQKELSDAMPLQKQERFAQGMLEHPLLADFDERQQQLGLSSLWIRNQEAKVELNLTIDVPDLVLVHFYRRIKLVQILRNDFWSAAHDERERGDAPMGSGCHVGPVLCGENKNDSKIGS